MSYWVVVTGNGTYWSNGVFRWTAKVSSAVKFFDKDSCETGISYLDQVEEEDLSLTAIEVKQ